MNILSTRTLCSLHILYLFYVVLCMQCWSIRLVHVNNTQVLVIFCCCCCCRSFMMIFLRMKHCRKTFSNHSHHFVSVLQWTFLMFNYLNRNVFPRLGERGKKNKHAATIFYVFVCICIGFTNLVMNSSYFETFCWDKWNIFRKRTTIMTK